MALSSIAPHLILLAPSHRLKRRFLPIPPSRFSKPSAAMPLLQLPALSHPLLNPNPRFLPIPLSRFSKPRLSARSSEGEAAGHPADEKASFSLTQMMRQLGSLFGLWYIFNIYKKQPFVILSFTIAYIMGNPSVNVPLGKVAVSFMHTIKVMKSFFADLLSAMRLGEGELFAKKVKEMMWWHTASFVIEICQKLDEEELEGDEEKLESLRRKNQVVNDQIKQAKAFLQSPQYYEQAKEIESLKREGLELRDQIKQAKALRQARQGIAAAADQGREGCGESKVDDAASSYDPTSGLVAELTVGNGGNM